MLPIDKAMAHVPVIYQEIRVVTNVAVIRQENDLAKLRRCVSPMLFVL
jgi:hypothetical protein